MTNKAIQDYIDNIIIPKYHKIWAKNELYDPGNLSHEEMGYIACLFYKDASWTDIYDVFNSDTPQKIKNFISYKSDSSILASLHLQNHMRQCVINFYLEKINNSIGIRYDSYLNDKNFT